MVSAGLVALLVEGKLIPRSRSRNDLRRHRPLPAAGGAVLHPCRRADDRSGHYDRRSCAVRQPLVGHVRGGLGHVNIRDLMLLRRDQRLGARRRGRARRGHMRMMKKAGYDKYYAAALSASTAIIGPIIPPSIIMIDLRADRQPRVDHGGLVSRRGDPGAHAHLALMVMNHWISVRRDYRHRATTAWRCASSRSASWKAHAGAALPRSSSGGILTRHVHAHRSLGGRGLLRAVRRQVFVPHAQARHAAGKFSPQRRWSPRRS